MIPERDQKELLLFPQSWGPWTLFFSFLILTPPPNFAAPYFFTTKPLSNCPILFLTPGRASWGDPQGRQGKIQLWACPPVPFQSSLTPTSAINTLIREKPLHVSSDCLPSVMSSQVSFISYAALTHLWSIIWLSFLSEPLALFPLFFCYNQLVNP